MGTPTGRMAKCVLIVDDNEAVRGAVRAILESNGLEVCGEASDGIEAVEKATELQPDVVILDVKMPKMNGIEAATILKRRLPTTRILLMSLYQIGPAVVSASGATAVFEKPDDIKKLPGYVKKLFEPPTVVNTFFVTES